MDDSSLATTQRRNECKDKITNNKFQMTNKIQFLIIKMTLINQFVIRSFVFDNYLRFEICDLLFETLRFSAFAREIYAIVAKNFVILTKILK